MSGRIGKVTPKPGFIQDASGQVVPAGSNVVPMRDGLINVMSGRGTSIDRAQHQFWHHMPLTADQILAAYRSNWLIAKIVDLPPTDMVREGRDVEFEGDDSEKLEAEEKRLRLWDAILEALRYGRLGGGAILILSDADATQPVRKGESVQVLKAVSRHRLTLGDQDWNVESDSFGEPAYFKLNGTEQRIHPSRVIPFKGEPVPDLGVAGWEDQYWGESIIAKVDRAVKNATAASDGFASLIEEAKVDIVRFANLGQMLAQPNGETLLRNRLDALNLGKSSYRAAALDKEDEWNQHQITWAGMPDVIRTYYALVAGAADIPATRLLGKAPDGMNATGEGDEANYRSMIRTRQEMTLRPIMERLDALIFPAINLNPDTPWSFAPLDTPSEKELAETEKLESETVKNYADSGLVPTYAMEKSTQGRLIASGRWPGLKDALDEMPDMEPGDPSDLEFTQQQEGGDPLSRGRGGSEMEADPPRRAANDAKPRTLYVHRKLLNGAEFLKWAKSQGFDSTLSADDFHVTIAFSRKPVDWMKMGESWTGKDGELTVQKGGARIVEPLGDKGAIVLLFNSSELAWRNEDMRRNGASWDWPEYQPHVTITYAGSDIDLSKVEPYRGELRFGPEIFAEVVEDWVKDKG